jgi:hypothetical protein
LWIPGRISTFFYSISFSMFKVCMQNRILSFSSRSGDTPYPLAPSARTGVRTVQVPLRDGVSDSLCEERRISIYFQELSLKMRFFVAPLLRMTYTGDFAYTL